MTIHIRELHSKPTDKALYKSLEAMDTTELEVLVILAQNCFSL